MGREDGGRELHVGGRRGRIDEGQRGLTGKPGEILTVVPTQQPAGTINAPLSQPSSVETTGTGQPGGGNQGKE